MENNTPKRRPTGVTVIAVVAILRAIYAFSYGLYLAASNAPIPNLPPELTNDPSIPLGFVRVVFTVAMLIAAAINLVLGIGLWKLHKWARIVVLVFAGIGLFFNIS
jgi:hypothetical protein